MIELKPDAPREAGESLAPYAAWLPTRVVTLAPAGLEKLIRARRTKA